ncbi:transmembrane protein 179-like isoform X1 [Tachypleus tridentatus]|uniref:transmembrane protein 179-like isoform X1 n=1 Tax=Tachypleus tridentatus TaxID=6853 RepID=UPI003FD0E504
MATRYNTKESSFKLIYWNISHIIIYMIAIASSLTGAIFFSVSEKKFNGHCPLYSDIVVVMVPGKNDSFRFVTDIHAEKRTKWGSSHSCNFCSFMLVASFVYGLTLVWFFCVCSGNGNIGATGVPNSWRLIPPALLFTVIMSVAMCVSAFMLTMGMRYFCHQIENGPIISCDAAQHITWEAYPYMNGFYSLHLEAELAMWTAALTWILALFVLSLRCVSGIDFKEKSNNTAKVTR